MRMRYHHLFMKKSGIKKAGMKKTGWLASLKAFSLFPALLFSAVFFSNAQAWAESTPACDVSASGRLYQVSITDVFLAGGFDGETTMDALKRHGNFGLGTFNGVDGEMILLENQVYQVKSDGRAVTVAGNAKTPLAVVTCFQPKQTLKVTQPMDQAMFQKWLDQQLQAVNGMFAIRVSGKFDHVKTRSNPPVTQKPYPPLASIISQNQKTFDFEQVDGDFVGFRLPGYMQHVNIPGYHFHFLTGDKSRGGHVLNYSVSNATVSIEPLSSFQVDVPNDDFFQNTDTQADRSQDLHKVEH